MKKILLIAALGVTSMTDVNAQLALQNFNASTLPSGWSMIKVDNNTPSTSLNAWIQSQMAANAWMIRTRTTSPVDSCMLTTSLFTPAGTADRWLLTPSFTVTNANMVLTWEDAQGIQGATDQLQVWVSPTAGTTTSSFTTKVYDANVTPFVDAVTYEKHGAALGAYNGQTIRVAFRNNSTNGGTIRLDNVQTEVPANPLDGAVTAVNFPRLVASTSTTPVKVSIKNNGAQNITSLNLTYSVDGGTPITQSFSSITIYPFCTSEVTFTTQISNPAIGGHSIVVNIVQVNGSADPVTTNNQGTRAFSVPSQSIQRAGLIEEFSSSTCPPCSSFNAVFDPLALTNNANVPSSNFNVVKYQMNWPGAGNDASYNSHGLSRRNYYGVNGIPNHFTNGLAGGSGNQAEITASKTAPAHMAISGTFTVDPTTSTSGNFSGSVSITPYFTITGGNYRVHMAVVERYYQNPANTTGQLDYRYIMRRMFPNGDGALVSSWTDGTAQTFTIPTTAYTIGSVAQMNYNMWTTPLAYDLVVFVQDDDENTVLQSRSIPSTWPVNVPTIGNDTKVIVSPNPASDYAVVSVDLGTAANMSVVVTDALGKVVFNKSEQLASGRHQMTINTAQFAAGLYNITIQTDKGSVTERLSVVK